MHIGFIEDTHLHGGTQIWVAEAVRHYLGLGIPVTLIAPAGSWVTDKCLDSDVRLITYDWQTVTSQETSQQRIWTDALAPCDVAVCTVHPPRQDFHCATFAALCIREGKLGTHLITKTGTIVPQYRCEFYWPNPHISSSIIAISDSTRQQLMSKCNFPAELITRIYQGTDLERFQPEANNGSRYPLPVDSYPILGSMGSFEPRKGQLILLEALARLASGPLPKIHLILVGDGPDEDAIRAQIKTLGLDRNVSIFPFTDQPQQIYKQIDITVLPSLYQEGLPNVIQESLAMGIPAVASQVGGVSEVVQDGVTGRTVEPGDPSQLAQTIIQLWNDQPSYRRMARAGRHLIEKQFNRKTQFGQYLNYFQERTS